MLKNKILQSGGDSSTSLRADSPASRSALPDREKEQRTTVISGRSLSGSLQKSGPVGSLVKMLLESPRWYSPARSLLWRVKPICSERRRSELRSSSDSSSIPYSKTLSQSDIPSSRLLYLLVPSARPTAGTESFSSPGGTTAKLLPTPIGWDGERGGARKLTGKGTTERANPSMDYSASLKDMAAAKLLPTPLSQGLKVNEGGRSNPIRLTLLPTPMATEISHAERTEALIAAGGKTFCSRKNGESRPNGLMDFLQFHGLLPTPTASAEKQGTTKDMRCGKSRKTTLNHFIAKEIVGNNSQLNPLFVEEMMGFPYLWTLLPFLSRNGAATQ